MRRIPQFWLGDFTVKSSPDGEEYVEFSAERGTKTRSGETVKSTNADARSFKPKMWATPENLLKCPVAIFKAFIQHWPPEMCTADSPLYLAINRKRNESFFLVQEAAIRSEPHRQNNKVACEGNHHHWQKDEPFCKKDNGGDIMQSKCAWLLSCNY